LEERTSVEVCRYVTDGVITLDNLESIGKKGTTYFRLFENGNRIRRDTFETRSKALDNFSTQPEA